MIRILHVLGGLDRGGAETMLMNIYRNIDKDKIQFDFVVHTNKVGEYEQEIVNGGGKIYHFPRYNIKNHMSYKKVWREFLQNHKEYKIIHGHQRGAAFIYLKLAKEDNRITIMHSHSTSSRGSGLEKILKNLLRYPMRNYVDYPFACSIKAGQWLFGNCILKNINFRVIKNGIDISKYIFDAEKREELQDKLGIKGKIVLGHVGSFSIPKNHMFLLDIFSEFNKNYPNSILLLVGDGELRSSIQDRIKALELQDRVIFIGVVSNVCDYLQTMDIFVFPSIFEGLPVSVVEAQASGLQCILSDSITNEIDLNCGLITWQSLKDNCKIWSETIGRHMKYCRKNTSKYISNAGYGIKETSKEITDIYLKINERII